MLLCKKIFFPRQPFEYEKVQYIAITFLRLCIGIMILDYGQNRSRFLVISRKRDHIFETKMSHVSLIVYRPIYIDKGLKQSKDSKNKRYSPSPPFKTQDTHNAATVIHTFSSAWFVLNMYQEV